MMSSDLATNSLISYKFNLELSDIDIARHANIGFFYWNVLMIMVIIVVTVISMRFIMPRFSGGGGNHRDAVDGKTSPLGDQEALAEV